MVDFWYLFDWHDYVYLGEDSQLKTALKSINVPKFPSVEGGKAASGASRSCQFTRLSDFGGISPSSLAFQVVQGPMQFLKQLFILFFCFLHRVNLVTTWNEVSVNLDFRSCSFS